MANGKYIIGQPYYAAGGFFLPQDFVGLNNFSYLDADQMDLNTIVNVPNQALIGGSTTGLPASDTVEGLNLALLKGNGPYGQSSWKQIQHSYHPIVRYMKRINRLSLLKQTTSISPGDAKLQKVKTNSFVNYTEPPVSFKIQAFEALFQLKDGDSVLLKNTFSNNLCSFTDPKINNQINFYGNEIQDQIYDKLKKIVVDKEVSPEFSPVESLEYIDYSEIVYPREKNTGLGKTRGRESYTVSSGSDNFNLKLGTSLAFWKNKIDDRLRSDAKARNAEGMIISSGSSFFGLTDMSIWPLDAEEPFLDLYLRKSSVSVTYPYYWAPLSPSSAAGTPLGGLDPDSTERVGNLNKNGELSYAGWIYGMLGINIQGKVRGRESDGYLTSSGPLPNFKGDGTANDGLNFSPTASFQYEFPNMMMSGSMRRVTPIEGSSGFVTGFRPTASLHLIAPI